MAGMKQSLPGLFRNTAAALRRSPNDMACAMAFSVGQLVDNLRTVKEGKATIDEFLNTTFSTATRPPSLIAWSRSTSTACSRRRVRSATRNVCRIGPIARRVARKAVKATKTRKRRNRRKGPSLSILLDAKKGPNDAAHRYPKGRAERQRAVRRVSLEN